MKAIYADSLTEKIKDRFCKDCARGKNCDTCYAASVLDLIQREPDIEEEDGKHFAKVCFNCGKRAVGWQHDYSFADYGIEGDGVVHVLQCNHCGAISSITVRRRKRMEVPKIKRCPFCGEKADLRTDNEEVWVECEECYARGPEFGLANNGGNSNIEAVVACVNGWNERSVVEEEEED